MVGEDLGLEDLDGHGLTGLVIGAAVNRAHAAPAQQLLLQLGAAEAAGNGGAKGVGTLLDALKKGGGFRVGGKSQLLLQKADTAVVLADSSGLLAALGVQLHQLAVGRFVEGVKGQPAAGVGDGGLELLLVAV